MKKGIIAVFFLAGVAIIINHCFDFYTDIIWPNIAVNVEREGIKVFVPYARKSTEEPENSEHGVNIFYLTPNGDGKIAIEQEIRRHMKIHGYSLEKGRGYIDIRGDKAVIRIRDKDALIRVSGMLEKLLGRKWQDFFLVEWEGKPGVRNFRYQSVETDKYGNVVIKDKK